MTDLLSHIVILDDPIKMELVTILIRGPFSECNWYQIPRYLLTYEEYMLLPQLSEHAYRCCYDTEWNYCIRRYNTTNGMIDTSRETISSRLDDFPDISALETRLVASFFLDDVWEKYRVLNVNVTPYAVLIDHTAVRHKF